MWCCIVAPDAATRRSTRDVCILQDSIDRRWTTAITVKRRVHATAPYTDGRSSLQQRRPLISPICWLFCNSPPILIETLTTIQNVVTLCVCIAMYSLSLKNLHFLFWRAVFLYNIIFNDVVRSPSVVIVACISTIEDTRQTECKLWIGQTMATEWRKTSFHVHQKSDNR